jgi:UDP-N-acetylglucosamine--N-acetylmuramyl-(pentapeptide) pyrophosphoryl-undecaprenol N-acetylglucosamine transferase
VNPDCIVLAGGGTGGHVFPLVAVADELSRLVPRLDLCFVGTPRGIESQVVPERGYRLELLDVEPIRGGGVAGAARGIRRALASLPASRRLLERLSPKAVFSIGGYAAGPVALAARSLGIPVALMEPNSVVGLANRLVAPLVARAYTTFPEVERHFARAAVLRTGVAIRRGFAPSVYGYDGQTLNVLVLGGSQGAKSLNETVPHALSRCAVPTRVVHQAGNGNDRAVQEVYTRLGADRSVHVTPFIRDMAQALARADLVVGRAGAGAVSEICAVGRPSLLIPYPFASGDHQYTNAASLERAGAAVCIRSAEATVERLTLELDALGQDSGRLLEMAQAAEALGHPEAAETVALDLLELAGIAVLADDDGPVASDHRASRGHEVH